MTDTDARIIDRGYRRYDGPRHGATGARRALYIHSLQRALGLRRGARHKIIPFATLALAYLPAAVFVGIVALVPRNVADDLAPRYSVYYGFISAAILLYVAAVIPDLLCTDRRTGMLGLYLAAPLDRKSYLATKSAAVLSVLSLITLGPPILLLIGYSFVDLGPGWPLDGLKLVGQIVASGLVVAGWYTALGMAVSAATDRRSWAAAGISLSVLVSSAVVAALVEGAGGAAWLHVFDLFGLPFEAVHRIYGEASDFPDVTTATIAVAIVGWLGVAVTFVAVRYRRLLVTK